VLSTFPEQHCAPLPAPTCCPAVKQHLFERHCVDGVVPVPPQQSAFTLQLGGVIHGYTQQKLPGVPWYPHEPVQHS
jgi:hypothetical protein